jgi:hypothetical protein
MAEEAVYGAVLGRVEALVHFFHFISTFAFGWWDGWMGGWYYSF